MNATPKEPDFSILDLPISELGLDARTANCLKKMSTDTGSFEEIATVRQLLGMTEKKLLARPGLGRGTLNGIIDFLSHYGLYLGMELPPLESEQGQPAEAPVDQGDSTDGAVGEGELRKAVYQVVTIDLQRTLRLFAEKFPDVSDHKIPISISGTDSPGFARVELTAECTKSAFARFIAHVLNNDSGTLELEAEVDGRTVKVTLTYSRYGKPGDFTIYY